MRYFWAVLYLWASGLCLSGLSYAAPHPDAPSAIDTQEVDRRINVLMSRPNMSGLAVAIVENGDLVFAKGYGETLKGSGDKVTEDTIFRWASLSKSVAAATVVSLAAEGHFGLNSPVTAHAASLTLPPSKHIATIGDVLSHQTGIIRNAYDQRIEDGQSPKTVRRALEGLPRMCEPGDCHAYQNVAFDAATEMTETVTGLPYKAVVSERFFKPLHMDTATLTREGLLRSKNWAKPHNRKGEPISLISSSYYRMPGAAGVNSSITDLAKWMQAQMGLSEDVLSAKMISTLQEPRVETPRENRNMMRHFFALQDAHYGLGWRMYDYDGHRVVGHRGAVSGYRSMVLFDPELKTGVAVMWNSSRGRPVGLQLEVMDQVYGLPRRDWMRLIGPQNAPK